MDERCWCGEILRHAYESWRCAGCGRACCPACADAAAGKVRCLGCTAGTAGVAA